MKRRKYYIAALLIFALSVLWGITGQTAKAAKKTATDSSINSTLKKGVLTISGKGTISSKYKDKG